MIDIYNRSAAPRRINKASAPKAAAAGHRVLMSNFDAWYLDHLGVPWQAMYANDILAGVEDPEQQRLFLGGEVCAWGETVDISDLQQTVWPRAAAAAGKFPRRKLRTLFFPLSGFVSRARRGVTKIVEGSSSCELLLLRKKGLGRSPFAQCRISRYLLLCPLGSRSCSLL